VAAWLWSSLTATDAGGGEIVDVLWPTSSLLPALGAAPQVGRNFTPEEEGFGKSRSALIGDKLWRARFGGTANALGKVSTLNGQPHTIVGVLPADFHVTGMRLTPEIWLPAGSAALDTSRTNLNYTTIARLRRGVTLAQAEQETNRIFAFDRPPAESGARLIDWQSDVTRSARRPFLLLLYASALLLLITCVNVAALLLGEGAARDGELAARAALGAGRGAATRVLRPFLFGVTPLDLSTYPIVLGASVLATIGAAWLPALRAARAQPPAAQERVAFVSIKALHPRCPSSVTGALCSRYTSWILERHTRPSAHCFVCVQSQSSRCVYVAHGDSTPTNYGNMKVVRVVRPIVSVTHHLPLHATPVDK
jgi:hypothetical protein